MGSLQYILDLLSSNSYRMSQHARIRMHERSITTVDIRSCARTGQITEEEQGRYRINGVDADGDALSIICAMDEELILITLF